MGNLCIRYVQDGRWNKSYISSNHEVSHMSQLHKHVLLLCVLLCCSMYCLCQLCCSVYCFVCKCMLCYCHRVSTQLQLTNISYQKSVSISFITPAFMSINCVNICTKVYKSSMLELPQREFREGSARYGMGRGGPRPVYDRERTDRSGLRRRDGPDRVPRFREYLRPRSPK